jgi:hypothetical protein
MYEKCKDLLNLRQKERFKMAGALLLEARIRAKEPERRGAGTHGALPKEIGKQKIESQEG